MVMNIKELTNVNWNNNDSSALGYVCETDNI